jgi:hypothetical protein
MQTERAFAQYLIGTGSQLITGSGIYVVENNCLRIRLTSGASYPFTVSRGQDDIERNAPGVVVYCASGTKIENWTTTMSVDVEVTLYFPADADEKTSVNLQAFELSADMLGQSLMRTDLLDLINMDQPAFTVQWGRGPWSEESGWTEPRLRTYKYRREFIVSPVNLHNPS